MIGMRNEGDWLEAIASIFEFKKGRLTMNQAH